jgi:hypothetical protein
MGSQPAPKLEKFCCEVLVLAGTPLRNRHPSRDQLALLTRLGTGDYQRIFASLAFATLNNQIASE